VKSSSFLVVVGALALAACGEHAAEPPKPAAIRVVAGDGNSGVVGRPLVVAPTIIVSDDRGNALANVSMTVSVVAGGGTVAGAPTKTTAAPTSIGTWTLGPKVGENRIRVEVPGLAPLLIAASATAGPAAKLTAASVQTLTARVGDVIRPAPSAVLTDAFDNPIGGATVTVAIDGGGAVPTMSLVTDGAGKADVGSWTLATTAGRQSITLAAGTLTSTFVATVLPGDPTQLIVVSGNGQRVLAGAAPAQPVVVRVADRFGNGVAAQDVSLAVTAGGGTISSPVARTGDDGLITISSWRAGRSAVPQGLRATSGAFVADIDAVIQSDFNIDIRFFGPDMTPDQKALFTNAAARLSGIITGDIPANPMINVNLTANCGLPGLPPSFTETVDDVVIYATVRPIDGSRNILARAGPCVVRQPTEGYLTLVGVMEFDVDDLGLMSANGYLQEVITHEMLHVIGVGTLWSAHSLLVFENTPAIGFIGAASQQGCIDFGGRITCEANVPVENLGGPGTAGAHWREATFGNELMTGYVNTGGMPLSQMTVGSLRDIGYQVNPFAADPFQLSTSPSMSIIPGPTAPAWEAELPTLSVIDGKGGTRVIRRAGGTSKVPY
jgi:hypothetical protein